MKDCVRLGIDYEKVFELEVLPGLNADWKRTGSVVGMNAVSYAHPVYQNKYAVPDYHLPGTNKWLEIKTVSSENANRGRVSFPQNEVLNFAKMVEQGQEILILRYVQGDASTNFKIHKFDLSAIKVLRKGYMLMCCGE